MLTTHHDLYTIRKLYLIAGLICFVLGFIAFSFGWRSFSALLLLASVLIFFGLYWLNEKYKEYKKLFFELLPNEKVLEMLNHGSFEFTNEHLIYQSKNVSEKINWTDFSDYKLINSVHIILTRKNTADYNMIISEPQMNKSDFTKIIDFTKDHVGTKTTYNNV